jgi:hypothetical protein
LSVLAHEFHQALGAHVGPVLLDIGQTISAAAAWSYRRPARRNRFEGPPKRVLPFVVDYYQVFSIFVFKKVRHEISFVIESFVFHENAGVQENVRSAISGSEVAAAGLTAAI